MTPAVTRKVNYASPCGMSDTKALKPSLKSFSEMKKTLSFQTDAFLSEHPWPQALLPVAFQGELLCGFNATVEWASELEPTTELTKVAKTFLELHPDLSFLDLFSLKKKLSLLPWGLEFFNNLVDQMASHQSDQWFKLLENLNLIPHELLSQWQQKKLQFGDLRPLLAFSIDNPEIPPNTFSIDVSNSIWSVLIDHNFSKSEWTHAIEWFSDLVLMGNKEELHSLKGVKTPREMILKLKELRYPETSKKDRLEQEFWKKLPWPKNTQTEFRRQGDQTKTYVSMNFGSVRDLKKITKELFDMAEKQESEH